MLAPALAAEPPAAPQPAAPQAAQPAVAQAWADAIAALDDQTLSNAVIEKLSLTMADCAGVWAYARRLPHCQTFARLSQAAGDDQATELVSGQKVTCEAAAAINAFALHAHEIDDSNLRNQLRASAAALPAVLAWAEHEEVSGRRFLLGLAVSYEASDRLANVMNRQPAGRLHARGWMPSSVCGVVGQAAGVGLLGGLTPEELSSAIGLAAGGAGGLFQYYFDGSDEKRIHLARAARQAVESVRLARQGFRGAPRSIEGRAGLLAAMGFPATAEGLLAPWSACDAIRHVKPKFYACSQGVIPWLEALEPLLDGAPLAPESIRRITLALDRPADDFYIAKINDFRPPGNLLEAQLSVNFGIALLCLRGAAFVDEFVPEALADPAVLEVARRVRAVRDPAADGRIEIELADGRKLAGRYDPAALARPYPPREVDYRRKFERLTTPALSDEGRQRLWQHARGVAEAANMRDWCGQLARLLQPAP